MKNFFVFVLIIAACSGCLKEQRPTCNYNACGFVAPAAEIKQVNEYLSANNITATQHCSGLSYIIENAGTGTAPTVCNAISFTYEGRLSNGTVFDKSTAPVAYYLSNLIDGWKNGIPLIKPGGKIRLFIPPSLGYGPNPDPSSNIPPNALLIFDVTLVGVLQ